MKKRLKSILGAALALCLMAGLAVPAGAYTAEVSELSSVTPSSSYVEVSSCSHYDGEHPLYIFPAGTTFQSAGYMVVQAWKIEADTGALDFYDSDYDSGSDGATFAPEAGVIYMIQESNQMDWFQYMYIMVEGGASIPEPEPEPEIVAGFNDVSTGAWYAGYVQTVVDKDLFAGVGEGTFAPESSMTYAQFLTVLYKFSGDQLPASQGAWYQSYVDWANNAGLVPDGMAGFNPDASITRQDMAALFGNFLDTYDHSAQPVTDEEPSFAYAGSIAGYASDGVTLCYQMGLMSGNDDGTFAPAATATRAQVAVTMTQMARVMGW